MPLRVIPHKPTGLTITGTVAGTRVRKRAESNSPKLAAEEAATIETSILRAAWHGERRGSRAFAEAVTAYLEAAPRSESTKARCRKLLLAVGTTRLADIDQGTVVRLRKQVLTPNASPATESRAIIVPLRAVLRHAHKRGWCDAPVFDIPRRPEGRTLYLLPDEAERLIAAAAPHLRPLLVFLLSTGARMSEAIELRISICWARGRFSGVLRAASGE
jgi:integrase